MALAASSIGLILAGCSNSKKEADNKTITITVDKGYKDYINRVKGDFEKKNGVKVEVKTKDALTALDNLKLEDQCFDRHRFTVLFLI